MTSRSTCHRNSAKERIKIRVVSFEKDDIGKGPPQGRVDLGGLDHKKEKSKKQEKALMRRLGGEKGDLQGDGK